MGREKTSESLRTKVLRWGFNLFPAFRRTGGRISHISNDHKTAEIVVPLNWKTRNYVGTIFGGSMFAAVDPIYMVMLMKLLGPEYVVWDKAATIRYKKPGRSTLRASFRVEDEELLMIRRELERSDSVERTYHVELVDSHGTTCAVIDKTLHVRKKRKD
jgi:acyl-coenzyme A thioesterase PaaI-like protein